MLFTALKRADFPLSVFSQLSKLLQPHWPDRFGVGVSERGGGAWEPTARPDLKKAVPTTVDQCKLISTGDKHSVHFNYAVQSAALNRNYRIVRFNKNPCVLNFFFF